MIYQGNSLDVLKTFEDNSIDAIVTDPPYGIAFMNKKWDYDVPSVELWKEAYRVLKPGGHMLVACGTRTQHRMVVNIEDAGFEVRDVITWLYGSGFPKSMDVSKAIDKMHGVQRDAVPLIRCDGKTQHNKDGGGWKQSSDKYVHHPVSDNSHTDAKKWQGFGTALKPACEFWTLVRKPLSESTVAKNVLKYGTGALNIDGCRIGTQVRTYKGMSPNSFDGVFRDDNWKPKNIKNTVSGRWPANLILDEEAGKLLDEQSGFLKSGELKGYKIPGASSNGHLAGKESRIIETSTASAGGASRFFYCAKASKSERNAGLDLAPVKVNDGRKTPIDNPYQRGETERVNTHPTVKPIKLMEYLCKLITPPGGTILDPFAGSGSTGVAAKKLGFDYIGIELNPEYAQIAKRRIEHVCEASA